MVPAQTKLAASSVLPVPVYFATAGYGHSGRVCSAPPVNVRLAVMRSGAMPCSTQSTTDCSRFCGCGPLPPLQWPTAGAMKWRKNCWVCA